MPFAIRRIPAFALLISLAVVVSAGAAKPQPDAKKDEAKVEIKAPEPTADEIKALADKFKIEREEALKAKFPPEAMTRADDLVKRAEAALANNNPRGAARYY